MRKHYDFSFLMLYCDNSGLLDVTELSNGNWQGNSPNMCLTHNIGIYWVVLKNYKEWRSLPAKFLLALQLLLLFSLVGKVQMWTLWVRVTTNNQLNMLLCLLELVAADCVLEYCDLPVTHLNDLTRLMECSVL